MRVRRLVEELRALVETDTSDADLVRDFKSLSKSDDFLKTHGFTDAKDILRKPPSKTVDYGLEYFNDDKADAELKKIEPGWKVMASANRKYIEGHSGEGRYTQFTLLRTPDGEFVVRKNDVELTDDAERRRDSRAPRHITSKFKHYRRKSAA